MAALSSPCPAPAAPLAMFRGSSKRLVLTVTTSQTQTPVDLTGAVVMFTVKESLDGESPVVLAKTSASSDAIEIIDASAGKALIKIDPTDTADFEAGKYVYDIWIALPTGEVYPAVPPSAFEVRIGVHDVLAI